jgi:hypothetical protein
LAKPLENDFSNIFSFKPKKTSNTAVSRAVSKDESMPTIAKRLSFGSSIDEMSTIKSQLGRSRSFSASNSTQDSTTQPQSHFSDNEDIVVSVAGIVRRKSNPNSNHGNIHYRSFRRQGSATSLTDALLPMDASGKETNVKEESESAAVAPRPTRLRFALPDTPSRTKSPGQHRLSAIQGGSANSLNNSTLNMAQKAAARKLGNKRAKSPGRSRWSLGYNTSDSSDDELNGKVKQVPLVGQKVELLRRPLPTQGTIKYIGEVEFAKGTWVGVELESRRKYLL